MRFQVLFLIMLIIGLQFANSEAAVISKGTGNPSCEETNSIHLGDTVVWINYYDRIYQVTSVDAYDHVDGNFDSGLVFPGNIFVHKFDKTGDFWYFCSIPHEKHAMIKVIDNKSFAETDPVFVLLNETRLTGKSSGGSLNVKLIADTPKAGDVMPIRIIFEGKYKEPLSDIDYVIIALQNKSLLPIEYDDNRFDNSVDYKIGPLLSDDPVVIQIKLLGLGNTNNPNYVNVVKGDTIILQTEGNVSLQDSISISSIKESTIPTWFRDVINWYDQKLVSEDEIINAIKFLISKNIIHLQHTN